MQALVEKIAEFIEEQHKDIAARTVAIKVREETDIYHSQLSLADSGHISSVS